MLTDIMRCAKVRKASKTMQLVQTYRTKRKNNIDKWLKHHGKLFLKIEMGINNTFNKQEV